MAPKRSMVLASLLVSAGFLALAPDGAALPEVPPRGVPVEIMGDGLVPEGVPGVYKCAPSLFDYVVYCYIPSERCGSANDHCRFRDNGSLGVCGGATCHVTKCDYEPGYNHPTTGDYRCTTVHLIP